MIYNFSEIFDDIYNENINTLENSKSIYVKFVRSERLLLFKKILCFIVIVITIPIFPISLLWYIPIVIYTNNLDLKQLKADDGNYIEILSKYLRLPLLNKIFSAINYDMLKGIDRAHYNVACYNEHYSIFQSTNLIEIPMSNKKYNIKLSNVFTQEEVTYYGSNDQKKTRIRSVFGGIVSMVELPFNINSNVVITEDNLANNVIELDMKSFENNFNVSSTNEVLAFQLLTTDVMHKLLEIKNNIYKERFDIVINNNFLYIRFHNITVFNFKIAKNIDKKLYQESVENVELVKNLTEEILNIVLNSNVV